MKDQTTLDFYDGEAATYAPWSAPKGDFPWLEKFLSLVPEDARLLDYGCGGGWAAKRMAETGRDVEAFDGSAGLVEEARAATGIDVKHLRFDEFAEADRYDGIWASFCLLHAPKSAMSDNLAGIAAALRPGGLLYLGLKEGSGEKRDSLDRFYAYYEQDEIRALLTAAGFIEIDIRTRPGKGYDGAPESAMHSYARRQ